MRVLTIAILAGGLLLADPIAGQSTLRLGTWNLEHLGYRQPPRKEADYAKMADVIRRTKVDVLAVQEIGGPEPLGKLCHAIGPGYSFVLGTTGGFRGNPGRISVGFVWNQRRVEFVQAEELLDLPRKVDGLPIFHRVPVAAVFRRRGGGLDFRAIVVHLKASRGSTNEAKRSAEVSMLANYLRELRQDENEDRDVVVLGDFNHTYGAPAHTAFMQHEVVSYLKPTRLRPTIVHFPEPIDHLAIGDGLEDELLTDSLTVHGDEAEADAVAWRSACSDHIPVTVDLRSEPDGDPRAQFRPVAKAHMLLPGAVPRPTAAKALTVGTAVDLITDDTTYHGVLAAPLGDWAILSLAEGGQVAIPRERIREVRPRKP